ncbi:MAG: hypothetical protein KGM44_12425 [bacterium]|nr:hypothetical protein [bacterium]
MHQSLLLIAAVIGVGIFHTLVPDHWVPIALAARQAGWTRAQTGRAAFGAGLGHTGSTLLIGVIVWLAGVAFAQRFGHAVELLSSAALVAFGVWTALAALRELRGGGPHHERVHAARDERERRSARLTLMLILGSSPMLEGIPAFFAASRFGFELLLLMALAFAASTVVTYVALCVASADAMHRISLGPLERYGELISGGVIAAIGVIFAIWPVGPRG